MVFGSGGEVSVSNGAAWELSARTVKAGHSDPLVKMMGDNAGASWWNTTSEMAWQSVGVASCASLMVWLALAVKLGSLGTCVGPQLLQFSDGQPLLQKQLAARNGQELACTHFAPDRCAQHWDIVRVTAPAVAVGPVFLGGDRIRRRRSNHIYSSAIVHVGKYWEYTS